MVCLCVCRRAKVVPELSKELESPNVDLEAQLHNVYCQEHQIDQHQPPLCVYVFVWFVCFVKSERSEENSLIL